MGVGGLVTGIMGASGHYPKVSEPGAGRVGKSYQGLLAAYLQSMPKIYANEAEYQPKYTALGVANTSAVRAGGAADVARLSPDLYDTARRYDPTVTGLLDTLGQQANEQLKTNGALDPGVKRNLQQNIRSSQAARGLGQGPGDAALEADYETQTMEQRRQANQNFASGVAKQTGDYYGDPFTRMLAVSGKPTTTPEIVSPQQSDSMMGTTYNAAASADIANQNAKTAMEQGFNSFD